MTSGRKNRGASLKAIASLALAAWFLAAAGACKAELVGRWPMDEGSGTKIYDDSGYGNEGTISGAGWADGIRGSGLVFDGIDDYVEVPCSASLDIRNGITIMAWARAEEHKTAKIVEKGDWDGHGLALDKWRGWKGGVYIDGDRRYSLDWGEGRPELARWYHLAVTYDGESLKLYVDGRQVSASDVIGSLKINKRDAFIGSNGGAQKFFSGTIDAAMIHDRALSAEEIEEHYNEYTGVKTIIRINFQPGGSEVPEGYAADDGSPYGPQEAFSLEYGWRRER